MVMLELRALDCGYGAGFRLRAVNLSIARGELAGVIGPNGSGKTTLLRAVSRGLKPRAGQVLIEGRDLWTLSRQAMARKIAVVSQFNVVTPMTVEEYVMLGRIPYYGRYQFVETKADRAVGERAMALTECLRFRDHPMHALSGGERQLALVARALAQEPELLLLDEPTSYLDIAHQVRIMDLIRRLNRDMGLTVVMVLHDLNVAGEYCERLVLMHDGGIHRDGPPDTVIDYRVLEDVYQTVLVVGRNAVSGRPYVFPVAEQLRRDHTGRRERDRPPDARNGGA